MLRERQVTLSIAPYDSVYAPNIFINDVPIGGMLPQEALDKLRSVASERMNGWSLAVAYQGHTYVTLNYGTLGLSISDDELYAALNEAWALTHTGSVYDRKAAIDALEGQAYRAYTTQHEADPGALMGLLNQIAPYVNAAPVDAQLIMFQPDSEEPFVIQQDKFGAQLDVDATRDEILALAAAGQGGTYVLVPQTVAPSVTLEQVREKVSLRSSAATSISTTSTENRNHNIRLSLSKLNGLVLEPGASFSFNDAVGFRTLKNGFAEALEYAYGDLVTGVGGGVCQASTTLYQAIVTAGLSIQERYPHSGAVDYTEMGQDATVYLTRDREIDFRFRNTSPGSIYIVARVRPSTNNSKRLVAEIKVYGQSLGDGVAYRLHSEKVRTLTPPTEKKRVVDQTGLIVTYNDQEKLKAAAQVGYVVETYLEKYERGGLVERRLLSSDTFKAKAAEYWIGSTPRIVP